MYGRPMALWSTLERRRAGSISPASAANHLRSSRLSRLELNVSVEIKSPHLGPITWLDIDCVEERYLLTGGADCTIAVFDLDGPGEKEAAPTNHDGGHGRQTGTSAARRSVTKRQRPKELKELGRTPRVPLSQSSSSYGGHRHSVSVVRWYPVDTGLFVSGAMDGVVKLWDTNTLEVAQEFDFKDKVFAAAMSAAPGQHHLIAVGNDNPRVRLCDIRSGAFAHSLTGHSEAVWACAWSPRSEYLLATGSADQTVRLWDIRRSGASACLISLDQHQGEEEDDEENGGLDYAPSGSGNHENISGSERGYWKHRKFVAPQSSKASKFARAHAGPVNSLCFTPDGLHLLTSGTDNRLRLWQVETGRNTMINYLQTKNRRRRPFGMTVAQPAGPRSETVFFPNDKSGNVLVFPLHAMDGRPKGQLRAHFDPVQCCAYRPGTQELVTCGADGLTLIWSAAAPPWASRASYLPSSMRGVGGGRKRKMSQDTEDQDMWSSDDDERGGAGAPAFSTPETITAVGDGGGNGISSDRRNRGEFVPPILTQERRSSPGSRGR